MKMQRLSKYLFMTITLMVVVIIVEIFFNLPLSRRFRRRRQYQRHDAATYDVEGHDDVIADKAEDHDGIRQPPSVTEKVYYVEKRRDFQQKDKNSHDSNQAQTSDNWPQLSKPYFSGPIPKSPFDPDFTVVWDFNVSAFLQRPEVSGQPPKIMTWVVKPRYIPPLPEPVRLRVCPEMPCRMTTNRQYQKESGALLWAAQLMTQRKPPVRSHPDQVYVLHNHEPQKADWVRFTGFRHPGWKSAFNWTFTYRLDSDFFGPYGIVVKRRSPVQKNYTQILAKKDKLVVQLVSACGTSGRREAYVKLLSQHIRVDQYGGCGKFRCPRSSDEACFQKFSTEYKFYLAFENAICKDYLSEKFFHYMAADVVVVARGDGDYRKHAPAGTFINTADFRSPEELAKHLLYLDSHPEEYLKILRAKDGYQPLFEDLPIRAANGEINYMTYHYHSVGWCEACRRLWNLDQHRRFYPDINRWFDKLNCHPPTDLRPH